MTLLPNDFWKKNLNNKNLNNNNKLPPVLLKNDSVFKYNPFNHFININKNSESANELFKKIINNTNYPFGFDIVSNVKRK
jgi:hypothetical protein